jgi:hypothetical protein
VSTADAVAFVGTVGSLLLGSVLQWIGMILVTGMVAHVTVAAAVGRRLSLGEAWAATRGKRWRLIGLACLVGLMLGAVVAVCVLVIVVAVVVLPTWAAVVFAVVAVPASLALCCWFYVRVCYLPAPALILEPVGVGGALGRGFRLTRRQFWRTFGIALLTVLISWIAGSILSAPFSIGAQVVPLVMNDSRFAVLALVVLSALGTVIQFAFVAPITSAVTALQYLDQRMRKEAYDVELLAAAGITAS